MNLNHYKEQIKKGHKSTAELITDVLRQAIIDGAIPAEDSLKQAELARVFGVSRIPVKEALVKLESEGFIIMHANSVAKVGALSQAELVELYDIRIALECLALKYAIPKLTTDHYLKLERTLCEADITNDSVKLGELNQVFHLGLYEPSRRHRLLSMLKQTHRHTDRYLRVAYAMLPYQRPSSEEHWEILKTCQDDDAAKAINLLNKHLSSVKQQIAEYLFHLNP